MKRAFLQKVKPVSCPSSSENVEAGQPEQAPLGAKRRARTSAAMIGLALSMGASSLLLPHHNDGAKAAEPGEDEATTSSVSRIAAVPSPTKVESIAANTPTVTMVEYVVREGQTLWQIAQKHHVSLESLAAANGLTPNAILRIGQTLKVPVATSALTGSSINFDTQAVAGRSAARAVLPQQLVASADLAVLPADSGSSPSSAARTERDAALGRLRQERERLKGSLAELRSEGLDGSGAAKEQPISTVSTEQPAAQLAGGGETLNRQRVSVPSVLPQSTLQPGTAMAEVNLQSLPYRVQPGDTVETIARAHHVPEAAIVAANRLPDPDWIRVSQSLTIPATASSVSSPAALSHQTPSTLVSQVIAPDSATLVSTRATTTPNLSPAPAGEQPAAQSETTLPTAITHQVQPGDTIAKIARTYSIPQSLLIDANHLSNPNVIFVGQVLQVPMSQPVRVNSPVQIASAEDSVLLPATQIEVGQPANAAQALAVMPAAATSETAPRSETIPSTAAAASGPNQYVAGLLSEVRALRARQQSSAPAPGVQQPAVVAASSVAQSAPELSVGGAIAAQATSSSQAASAAPTGAQARVPALPPASPTSAPQSNLVAAAPLGSERYDPLLQPLTGRMVSPDLPPLPGADRFLPGQMFNGYSWPARGMLTSGYGWRWGRMHQGIDIAADVGTPIYAAADGVVEYAGWNSGGYGNMVEVRHADGSMTRYAHLNAIHVRSGQQVNQGEQIAEMGSTGYSTGPHLHFEVHLPNRGTVNPIAYLPQR